MGQVPPKGKALLMLRKQTIDELISEIDPTRIIAFSRDGKARPLKDVMQELTKEEKPLVIIGGFARGSFSKRLRKLVDEFVAIDPEVLETWVIVSRAIYAYEMAIGLPKRRLKRLFKPNRF
jgi:rRNA small subunit pseudouridine methyltransferase Nep1